MIISEWLQILVEMFIEYVSSHTSKPQGFAENVNIPMFAESQNPLLIAGKSRSGRHFAWWRCFFRSENLPFSEPFSHQIIPALGLVYCYLSSRGGETVGPMFMLHFLSGMIQFRKKKKKYGNIMRVANVWLNQVESVWKILWEYQCMYDVPSGYLT